MKKYNSIHRWNTKSFIQRTKKLNREDLEKLYPSESWALFRIITKVKNVIDLGCGNGAMSSIVNKINKKCNYTGLDHQSFLIRQAKIKYKYSKFLDKDLKNFISENKKKYDLVMMWSVIKSIQNWRDLILKSLTFANRYVIFDIRVTRGNLEKFDEKVLHAKYGNRKGAQLVLGYQSLKNFLLKQKKQIKKIEIAGYKSDWGKNVIYRLKKKETYLITVVIYKNINNSKKKINLYEQIPAELSK